MRHCLTPLDFTTQELDQLFDLAADIEKNPGKYAHACEGKKIATLFYEPSTRTRLSFEAAMMNLGGKALGFAGAAQSSAAKGESVADTIRVVSCFADIAAIRHNKEGAAYVASRFSDIPVINAGDGGHEHPTQTLLDMMTIRQLKGRLNHFTIGICGDLKFGRTVHSLVKTLAPTRISTSCSSLRLSFVFPTTSQIFWRRRVTPMKNALSLRMSSPSLTFST